MVRFPSLVFFIYSISGVLSDADMEIDFTKCISDSHTNFIKGIENLVNSSDPLLVDVIPVNLPELKYRLTNVELTGLKNCKVVKVRVNKEKLTFEYSLDCSHLEVTSKYFLRGHIANIFVEGDGDVWVTMGHYILIFHGYYEKNVGMDNLEYGHIKNYYVDFDAQDPLVFNFTNLYGGDKEKSDSLHKFMNENWSFMDKQLRASVLSGFTDVFIDHLNDFLKAVPIQKVFYSC